MLISKGILNVSVFLLVRKPSSISKNQISLIIKITLLKVMLLILKEKRLMKLKVIGIDRFVIGKWIKVTFKFVSLLKKELIIIVSSFSLLNWLLILIIYLLLC
jgi:hypothetical protein